MLRTLKRLSWLGLLAGGAQVSFAFSLLGPFNEAYQVPVIGYNLTGDIGAPKNLAQEYRVNTPVLYYSCDGNFWDYFGARGVAEIDKAFGAFNQVLTNGVSTFSNDLTEFPTTSRRMNYRAASLGLIDLKSFAMTLIIEHLGLAEPERYIWALHDRYLPAGATCPQGEIYLIVKRNFDAVIGTSLSQLKPSSYVNGTLYSYQLLEFCDAPLPPQAYCNPIPVDPTADSYTAIASGFGYNNQFVGSPFGSFFTGLTRDDVGGLRYLLRAPNMNVESAGPNTVTLITNPVPQLIVTSNLTLLASAALTNDAGPLQALFPDVVVLATSNYFVNVNLTNFTAYFTNFPWDPIRTAPHLAFVTNITPTVQTRYVHTFANLLGIVPTADGWITVPIPTLPASPNGRELVSVEISSVAISNSPWAPVGSTNVLTNTFLTTYLTNAIVGDYIVAPTNACEIGIVRSQLTNFISYTNVIISATNNFATTNNLGATNGTVLFYQEQLITYFTNHTFVIYPVICDATNVALRQGIEKISFIRRDYDSLLTRFFRPITNEYVLTSVTNGQAVPHIVRRVVTTPDFVITAQDLLAGPDARPFTFPMARSINFNQANVYPGLAGPGTIETPTQFTFNNAGPVYENFGMVATNLYLTELNQVTVYAWSSFDGTTNEPVLYPNDASITDMEMQVLVQVSPPYLPIGTVGTDYLAQLQVQASTSTWVTSTNYVWDIAPNSPGLPPGLQIARAADGSGMIFGTPTQPGTFDFVIRVTDTLGHKVDRSYAIRINP